MTIFNDAAIFQIETSRLSLILLSAPFLRLSFAGKRAEAAALLGFSIPSDWFEEKELIALRTDDLRINPDYRPFSLRGICLKETREMVGFIGFHASPGPAELDFTKADVLECGYQIFPPYRNQGYAQEALLGIMSWAKETQSVDNFVLSIAPTNRASLAIAEKCGFHKVGERIDPDDGFEEVYWLDASYAVKAS